MAETVLLQLSNLCHDPRTVALGGIDELNDRLEAIQGDESTPCYPGGHVVTPTRALVRSLRGMRPDQNNLGEGMVAISGTEQSWGPGLAEGMRRAAGKLSRPKEAVKTLVLSAIMTESEQSLPVIAQIGEAVGQPLAVVRPEVPRPDGSFIDFTGYNFRRTGVQLKPGLFINLADTPTRGDGYIRPTPDEQALLHARLREAGVHGIVLDGHWAQAEAEGHKGVSFHLGDLQSGRSIFAASTLQSDTGIPLLGLHVAAGRTDSKHPDDRARSAKELAALIEGPEALVETDLGQLMIRGYGIWRDQLRRAWWKLDTSLYERARLAADKDPRQLVTGSLPASVVKATGEAAMRGVLSPALLPVTVEITNKGLAEYKASRGGGELTQADSAALLRTAAQNLQAFFADLEKQWRTDTTPGDAAKMLASLGRPAPAF